LIPEPIMIAVHIPRLTHADCPARGVTPAHARDGGKRDGDGGVTV
jgi:hypothetical protein